MPAKQLVYKAMVAMPAILLASLGAKSRIEYDPFEFVSPTPRQNNAILAYKEVVAASEKFGKSTFRTDDVAEARRIAGLWIDGAKSGKLTALLPISYDDNSREGIKGEIALQNTALSSFLLYCANEEDQAGKAKDAVQDSLLGIRIINILKYSDFQSLSQSSLLERRGLHIIAHSIPALNMGARAQVASDLRSMMPNQDRFKQVCELERFMFLEYLRRMGVDATRIEAIRPFAASGVRIPNDDFRGTLLASARDDTLPAAQQQEKLAALAEAEVAKLYNRVIKEAKSNAPQSTPRRTSPPPTTWEQEFSIDMMP